MKLTRKLIAAMLSVCMVLALLTNASAASLKANYGAASYYDIAVTTYSRMLAFQNGGVVPAANQSKQYGLIDPSGRQVLPFQYAYVWTLGGGLFAVAQKDNGYGSFSGLGVVNAQGKTLLAPSEDNVSISCQNGIVSVGSRTKTAAGGYDYSVKYYTTDWQPSTEDAYQGDSGEGGYVDNTPDALKKYDYYDVVGDFYRVHSYDEDYNELTGLLDGSFKVVIPLGSYQYVGSTNADGYTSVTKNDGSTDLYKGGKVVKTFNKEVSTEVYFRHLAFSTNGEKHGMMDVNEKVLLPEQYDIIDTDGNGNLLTQNENPDDWGYICGLYTQDCKQILADKYAEITYLTDSKYRINDGQYFGVSKVSGTTVTPVIPMKYLDLRTHTYHFVELYDGSKYSVVDLDNKVIVPESSQPINAFNGDGGGLSETLDRVNWYGVEYDSYDKSVLPFLSQTGSGWVTVYADYKTGQTQGQLDGVRASNVNGDGWFVYQDAKGLFGFGRLEGTGFLDILPGHWAEKAVSWAVNHDPQITDGVGGGKFDANKSCSNAMILTFLHRAAGEPVSTAQAPVELKGTEWYAAALRWAAEKGMIGQGFDPNADCTSAAAMKFIWQALGSQKPKGSCSFTDVPAGADYADAVAWAEENGITNGEGGGLFAPGKVCNRGRIVTFLHRAYEESARLH